MLNGRKFVAVHSERTVACDMHDDFIGISQSGADCGPRSVAHRAQAAGS